MAKTKPASGAEVRAWGRANPESVPEEARRGLGDKSRGRIHPGLAAAFNQHNPGRAYVVGTTSGPTVTLSVVKRDSKGRKRTTKREVSVPEARRLAGDAAKGKGRLSASALTAAAEAYAAQ